MGMGYHIDSCETLSFWSTYSIRAIGPLAIGPLLDIYGTRSRLLLHYASRMSEVCPKLIRCVGIGRRVSEVSDRTCGGYQGSFGTHHFDLGVISLSPNLPPSPNPPHCLSYAPKESSGAQFDDGGANAPPHCCTC